MEQVIDKAAGPIIVFDGDCVLCSTNAQFVLRQDQRQLFRLAAMQSPAGAQLFDENGIDPNDPETLIVVDGDKVLRNSNAILFIWHNLGWPWRLASVFRLIPLGIRDIIYRWVARNRYRLFGQRQTCWVPNPKDAHRLL
jgi:predicted DCC family thiol-disulfide oxidoreductase YuxK